MAVILRKWCLFSFGLVVGNGGGMNLMELGGMSLLKVSENGIYGEVLNVLAGVGIFAGVYYVLYKISKEKWVGAGDWQMAMMIALLMGDFFLALLCVFVANFLASVIMIPVVKMKKKKNTKIYFGPWMVAGMAVVMMVSEMVMGMLG